MLDANFVGYEKERQALLDAPKYGNDDDEADEIAVRVLNNISDLHAEGGKQTTLYRYHIVSVNNSVPQNAERSPLLRHAAESRRTSFQRQQPINRRGQERINGNAQFNAEI